MNRKIDSQERANFHFLSGVKELVPIMRPNANGVKVVDFVWKDIAEIAPQVLNPDIVNLASVIETGVPIDPKNFIKVFNITDPADLEKFREGRSQSLFKYVQEHESEIKAALVPEDMIVEPE